MKTTEKTSTRKARKATPKVTAPEAPTTKKVFVTGPWRTGKGEMEKDYYQVRVGFSPKDESAKYSYKMFGPLERVIDMAQRIAADQKLELVK